METFDQWARRHGRCAREYEKTTHVGLDVMGREHSEYKETGRTLYEDGAWTKDMLGGVATNEPPTNALELLRARIAFHNALAMAKDYAASRILQWARERLMNVMSRLAANDVPWPWAEFDDMHPVIDNSYTQRRRINGVNVPDFDTATGCKLLEEIAAKEREAAAELETEWQALRQERQREDAERIARQREADRVAREAAEHKAERERRRQEVVMAATTAAAAAAMQEFDAQQVEV